jgi:hypothetical protein
LEKLILLDNKIDKLGEIACVYQDFESDIFSALIELDLHLKKYRFIKLIFPKESYLPEGIKTGFLKFCSEFDYGYGIVEDAVNEKIEKNTVYINVDENDLIHLIKQVNGSDFIIGEDIGIISYNDSSLKEVLLDGITVISTDFDLLGEQAAFMILRNEKEQIRNRFDIFLRNSL